MSRVILFPSAYLPDLGGVEELTRHLALALKSAGDHVEVWTNQGDSSKGSTLESLDGIAVRRFPCPLPQADLKVLGRSSIQSWRSLAAMRKAYQEFQPDLIHVQCFGPNGAYATLLSLVTGTPLVITLQGETVMDDRDIFDHSVSLRTAIRLGLRRAAGVTGCSAFTLGDAENRFALPPGRGQVIFNGVDMSTASKSSPAVSHRRYVLALGRIVEKKGFDLLIHAFARIAHRHPEVELIIAGAGPALNELSRLCSDLGVSEVVSFPGRLSREAVAGAMAGAELFVMPSRLEPFGIVVLEAWAAETAVIATSRGGPPEFVDDGINGLLVDPFDTDSFATTLDSALSDSGLRSSLGSAGRLRVRDFAWQRIAAQYRDLYAGVIQRSSARLEASKVP